MKELKHFCSHGETERDSPRSLNLLPEQERRAFAVCKLLEVKDFKHLSIKPELAGSFNVRLDLRGGVMGVFGHCVGDAVPMRSHPPDAIHHNSSSPSQLCACYSVFQSVKRLCLS